MLNFEYRVVSPHLISSMGFATLSKINYNETNLSQANRYKQELIHYISSTLKCNDVEQHVI